MNHKCKIRLGINYQESAKKLNEFIAWSIQQRIKRYSSRIDFNEFTLVSF